jgi:antibiotic biosynthesis monooxygenase (ABM) superfamily enzyme
MEYLPNESKPGYFDAYRHENGKKYLVLEGLYPEDVHTPGTLELFMHQHYDRIVVAYWILFVVTLLYLVAVYLVLPLVEKFHLQTWLIHEKKNN